MPELDDLAAQCIQCGFCLEACPTFVLSADETQSPRGRINIARHAEATGQWDTQAAQALDSCLGCRACETACPSGVQYGKILELARARVEQNRLLRFPARKPLVDVLTSPTAARLQFALGGLSPTGKAPALVNRLLADSPPEAQVPALPDPTPFPPLDPQTLPPVKGEVYLLEGCVMRVLYPDVHEATRRLLRRVGFTVREAPQACCGALHAHAGYLPDAEARAQKLAAAMPLDIPVVINSAGCGSTIKEYGGVIGHNLAPFAKKAAEASTFLLQNGLPQALAHSPGLPSVTATYHDACHLLHGQKVKDPPRQLLRAIPGLHLVELPESDMCCGSAGTYNIFQPAKARALLDRKWANIAATQATILATGNPGCQAWIAQASQENGQPVRVLHTLDLLEASFSGLRL